MRKLEGVVKEVVDELGYLKEREVRFQTTNGKYTPLASQFYDFLPADFYIFLRVHEQPRSEFRIIIAGHVNRSGRLADLPSSGLLQTEISYRLICPSVSFSPEWTCWQRVLVRARVKSTCEFATLEKLSLCSTKSINTSFTHLTYCFCLQYLNETIPSAKKHSSYPSQAPPPFLNRFTITVPTS